jgi:hypothetical protein
LHLVPLRTFLRPNHFLGKLPSVEDLQREQAYHRDKGRLRNRVLFGPGVVSGLHVSVEQNEVVVSPGLAYDCQGNELVVAIEHRLPVPVAAGRHVVTIGYAEIAAGAMPMPDGSVEPAYFEETVTIDVVPQCPACPATSVGRRIQGCEPPHAVCIAALRLQGTRWRATRPRPGTRRWPTAAGRRCDRTPR